MDNGGVMIKKKCWLAGWKVDCIKNNRNKRQIHGAKKRTSQAFSHWDLKKSREGVNHSWHL